MTTYAEFKAFYLREIWRTGDTDLEGDLDKLIKRAEAKIKRDLSQNSLITSVEQAISTSSIPLPGDFSELVDVTLNGWPVMLVSPAEGRALLSPSLQSTSRGTCYWIYGGRLHFNLPDTYTTEIALSMRYYTGLTPYADDPVSPYYDANPDFYTAAVNVEVYKYLRDFELSAEYNGQYAALLEAMQCRSNYTMFPSGQLETPMPIPEAVIRNSPVTPPFAGGDWDAGDPVYEVD